MLVPDAHYPSQRMTETSHPTNERGRRATAAKRLQRCLHRRTAITGQPKTVTHIAGVDCAFPRNKAYSRAAAILMDWPGLSVVAEATAEEPTRFPYVPGLLSFRELPVIRAALAELPQRPDLVLCDGQGVAHPRRVGIATHLGLATGLITVGVGKSRLVGTHAEPGPLKGDTAALMDGEERIGTVLRSRDRVRPLFVSPGHGIDHAGATKWVLACCTRYRLPEPVRAADHRAGSRQP